EDERVFHEYYPLTQKTKCIVVRILKIYKAIRDENRIPTMTRKDIFNIDLQINSLEETILIEILIVEMEEREYT
ncbi:12608_t:CDS:1, partial [Racocetra persica]